MNLRDHKLGDMFLDENGYLWYWDNQYNGTDWFNKINEFSLRLIPSVYHVDLKLSVAVNFPFPETVKKETNARRWGWILDFDETGRAINPQSSNHVTRITEHLTKEEFPEYYL